MKPHKFQIVKEGDYYSVQLKWKYIPIWIKWTVTESQDFFKQFWAGDHTRRLDQGHFPEKVLENEVRMWYKKNFTDATEIKTF